jgi:hypothetical protein
MEMLDEPTPEGFVLQRTLNQLYLSGEDFQ